MTDPRLSAVTAALGGLFPKTTALAVEPVVAASLPDLWPEERPALAAATPTRLAEFAAGRRAARRALAALGLPGVALPMGPDRAPLWPTGLFGAISHGAGLALAVASRSHPVGVDLEEDTPLEPALWSTLCSAAELSRMSDRTRGLMVRRTFAAKEAVFKAQRPETRALFGFDAVDVTLAAAGFSAHVLIDAGSFHRGQRLQGRTAAVAGLFIAGVTV